MKLAFVAPAYPYRGGISHFAMRLARHLEGQGASLFINFKRLYPGILFPGKSQFDTGEQAFKYPSERILDSVSPASWFRAAHRIRKFRPDAVIFHWWHPFFAPAFREIATRLPRSIVKIGICHNVAPHDAGALKRFGIRMGLAGMDGYALHAASEVDELNTLLPGRPYVKLFHPIYDIFPGERIPKAVARKLLGIPETARVLLYFGLIRPYKGVEVLLRAASQLKDMENLLILVSGEIYSNRHEIESLIAALPKGLVRLENRYIPNEDVAVRFRAADLIALPYRSATQSGIVPIAYRCGRPVVVTRVGGLPEVVSEGKTGYLVEPDNPTGLADAIRRHFSGEMPNMTSEIEAMCKELSWERYASRLTSFITKLQQSRP